MRTVSVPSADAFRPVVVAASLFVAAGAAGGCQAVTIAPESAAWTVAGEDDDAVAVWAAGDVSVVVPLRQPADATTVAAEVRNGGPAGASLTFAAPPGASNRIAVGIASGGPPSFEREWTSDLLPGRPLELPAGTAGRPGTVRLALRPDTRWGPDAPPAVGSRVTLEFTLVTRGGTAVCPLRFRVIGSPDGGWEGLTATGRALVVLLLAAATAALVVWAN